MKKHQMITPRISPELHEKLKDLASANGTSLNQTVIEILNREFRVTDRQIANAEVLQWVVKTGGSPPNIHLAAVKAMGQC